MAVSRFVRSPVYSQSKRGKQGNVIVFMAAISCTFLLAFMLFALSFARFVGTNHEQKSGIESASLAAAKDLSRIVIDDPNFGLIGLSDSAPIGKTSLAKDGYYTQVHSINSLFGTIRLDMIIADELNDPVMKQFAQRDYDNAKLTAATLVAVLQNSLLPSSGGSGGGGGNGSTLTKFIDVYGNQVTPYDDAVTAYESNQIRMAGQSTYVEGSMKLTLGSILGGGPTNTPIPQPTSYAQAGGNLSFDGNYMSYVDVPYGSVDFVFAGVGEAIKLVDATKFVTDDNSLPYTIPTIVKAEADQKLLQGQDVSGRIVHAVACAQPASTADPVPAPGKLSITFIGKHIGKLQNPVDLITDPEIGTPTPTLSSSKGGDTPGTGTLAPITWPLPGPPTLGKVYSGGFYTWIRRGGVKPRVDALKQMFAQQFLTAAVTGDVMQTYEFEADGTILQTLHTSSLTPTLQESQNQLHASATISATDSSGSVATYTATVRNWVWQPGRKKGGRHAGRPLTDPLLDTTILAQSHIGSSLALAPGNNNLEIAQGLELGAGGMGAGGPGGGDCGGGDNGGGDSCGGGGDYDDGGGSCSGGGGSYSGGGSCSGGGGFYSGGGGSCSGGGGSCSSGGGTGSTCTSGGSVITFTQGPGGGSGAVPKEYTHNGLDVDFLFVDTSTTTGTSGGPGSTGSTTSAQAGG